MSIQFNKVTWYSKLAAVIVFFVFIPWVAFYLGNYYEQTRILIEGIRNDVNANGPIEIQRNPNVGRINLVSTSTYSTSSRSMTATSSYATSSKSVTSTSSGSMVACTMEAKQCPDGSYVGRSGPNCEFTPCPVIHKFKINSNSY